MIVRFVKYQKFVCIILILFYNAISLSNFFIIKAVLMIALLIYWSISHLHALQKQISVFLNLYFARVIVVMKVKVKKWHAIASWHWQTSDDSCGICRYPFEYCCANCKTAGDDCPIGKVESQPMLISWLLFDYFCCSVGPVFSLFSYALYTQVATISTN